MIRIIWSNPVSVRLFPVQFSNVSWPYLNLLPRFRQTALTCFFVGVLFPSLPERNKSPKVSPQHSPTEGRHGVDSHQATDEGVLAAFQQSHDVGPHVVSVLLPKVLRSGRKWQHWAIFLDKEYIYIANQMCRFLTCNSKKRLVTQGNA